jgi:bacterioferritin-associated ferredoxin
MYVCLCNGLNEATVREAIDAGARSVAGIYQQLDCAPSCGKCTPFIRELLHRYAPLHEVGGDPTAAA